MPLKPFLGASRIKSGNELIESLSEICSQNRDPWFIDIEDEHVLAAYRVREILYSQQSEYQLIELVEFENWGRGLILDGRIQMTEADEFIYHEMLVCPAMMWTHPRRVLILGGGDGCTAREILRWNCVEQVRLVELDGAILDLFQNKYPEWAEGAFDDSRLEVQCKDAIEVLNSDETWDLIIGDLTEPYDDSGAAGDLSSSLFGPEFFRLIAKKLNPRGMFAIQSGGIVLGNHSLNKHHVQIVSDLAMNIGPLRIACEYIPSFNSMWTCSFAAKNDDRFIDPDLDRTLGFEEVKGLRYYHGQTHGRLFALRLASGFQAVYESPLGD